MKNDIEQAKACPLGREKNIEQLKDLISTSSGSTVYAVIGEFGSGKTVFCEKLKTSLDEITNITCVWINAWKSDFMKEPLIPLLSELKKKLDTSCLKKFLAGFEEAMDTILKLIPFHGFNVCQAIKEEETIFSKYEALSKEIDNFRKVFNALPKDKKIIIFIDELDRCRPDYAIKFLETMKHIFDGSCID